MEEPPVKKVKRQVEMKHKRLIVILENAQLESAQVGRKYELLCSDKHANFLRKQGKDPADYRPDITHQCLLMLLDSPLNRSAMLQIYIHTAKNVLIEISPQTRIPRTFDRFCGLMVQLLHKMSIRADDGAEKLMKVVKNPVSARLPIGCRKVGTSVRAPPLGDIGKLAPSDDQPIAVVVGAMSRGKVKVDYTEEEYSISSFPLSAALTCAKLCHMLEEMWNIT